MSLVTVITPLYNKERTVARTIQSVLEQSHSDIEYLVVDNNSTDQSKKIAESYYDPRIKILSCPEQGVFNARNLGIKYSHGDYITFLDADDFLGTDSIQRRIDFLDKNIDIDIVITDYIRCTRFGNQLERVPESVSLDMMKYKNCIPMLTAMVRRSSIGNTVFTEAKHEDYIFWIELLRKCNVARVDGNDAYYDALEPGLSSNKIKSAKWHYEVLISQFELGKVHACALTFQRSIRLILKRIGGKL